MRLFFVRPKERKIIYEIYCSNCPFLLIVEFITTQFEKLYQAVSHAV